MILFFFFFLQHYTLVYPFQPARVAVHCSQKLAVCECDIAIYTHVGKTHRSLTSDIKETFISSPFLAKSSVQNI